MHSNSSVKLKTTSHRSLARIFTVTQSRPYLFHPPSLSFLSVPATSYFPLVIRVTTLPRPSVRRAATPPHSHPHLAAAGTVTNFFFVFTFQLKVNLDALPSFRIEGQYFCSQLLLTPSSQLQIAKLQLWEYQDVRGKKRGKEGEAIGVY